jgi:hypothetical protein
MHPRRANGRRGRSRGPADGRGRSQQDGRRRVPGRETARPRCSTRRHASRLATRRAVVIGEEVPSQSTRFRTFLTALPCRPGRQRTAAGAPGPGSTTNPTPLAMSSWLRTRASRLPSSAAATQHIAFDIVATDFPRVPPGRDVCRLCGRSRCSRRSCRWPRPSRRTSTGGAISQRNPGRRSER